MKKLIKLSTFLLLSFAIFTQCKKDKSEPLEFEITRNEDLQTALYSKMSSGDFLIQFDLVEIDNRSIYRTIFSNYDSLLIASNLLDSISRNEWQATFYLVNGNQITTDALGSSLFIDDNYSFELNPSNNNPLAARINLELPVEGKIKIEVKEQGLLGVPISHTFNAWDSTHALPILGLYENYENTIYVSLLNSNNQELLKDSTFIRTENVDSPDIDIIINNLESSDDGIYFNSDLKMGVDHRGKLRWMWTHPAHYIFRKLANGNLIITSNENMIMYHTQRFFEVNMLGEIIQTYETPNYQHHEVKELPNGNFIVATNSTPINPGNGMNQEDYIEEFDRNTGQVVKTWDLNTILDNQRRRIPGERAEDWLHLNSIHYSSFDESLIISGRAQSCVVSFDYETQEINWILGHHYDWDSPHSEKLLTPVDENGIEINTSEIDFWPYGQHAAFPISETNILVYDNGRYRNYYDDFNAPSDSYSRAVEYKIDKENMTVELVWEYNADKMLFTPFTGDVDILPNGNRLIGFMWGSSKTPRIVELNQNNNIVFEAKINQGQNTYRIEKFSLYDGLD